MRSSASWILALASLRHERRILEFSPALIRASHLSEILFEPKAVEHVGHRPERDASITPFDGAQRRPRHARPLGQEHRGEPAIRVVPGRFVANETQYCRRRLLGAVPRTARWKPR
jgi:hypothetical protein